jgi:hypothetical protein
MGKEDQISVRLQQGSTPRQLVAEGFSKSTVYKVAETLRSHQVAAPSSPIMVELRTDQDRYLPADSAYANFTVSNRTAADLYLFQAGVRPEWLPPTEWIPTIVRRLLGAGESMVVRLTIPVPPDVPLGEKDLYFGLQGQWVGPQSASPSNEMMWTSPLPLRIQRPRVGARVFLAHSVLDLSLVRQLAMTLDDNGIEAVLSEEGEAATFQSIRGTDFLVAVITHPHRIATAAAEIGMARKNTKDMLLLRDVELASFMPKPLSELAWTDVNFSLGATGVMRQLFSEVTHTVTLRTNARKKDNEDTLNVILLGLGALAAGVAIAYGRSGS